MKQTHPLPINHLLTPTLSISDGERGSEEPVTRIRPRTGSPGAIPESSKLSANLVLVLALIWAAGCGDRSVSENLSDGPKNAMAQATPLEDSLARWRAGDQAGAVQHFMEIDWKQGSPAFAPGSPLSLRESDLPAMSATDRERRVGEAMVQLRDLKQLAAAVREKGTMAAATDPALARRCFAKLEECGTALDQPEALKILQLMAQVVRKMGSPEAVPSGR